MNLHSKKAVLSIFITLALGGALASDLHAQSARGNKGQKVEQKFPEATRTEPGVKASSKLSKKLQKLFEAYNKDEDAQIRPLADEILATDGANEYDRSIAAQLAAQAAYEQDDNAAAKAYLRQVLDINGLDNNGHYQSMLMLAQLQIMDDEFEPGLATLDRYLQESKSTKPDDLALKGQTLYQMERYQDAIPVLKNLVAATPDPKDSWVQLLIASYQETDRTAEAVTLAEQFAAKKPDDKKAQMKLAEVYTQADDMPKAAAILEKVRASGQLSEEREYRQLYVAYANMDGRENDVITVIDEGIKKGLLKPDHQVYLALAQAYYYTDRIPQAIENWQKAAPLSKDGNTYYNLAQVLLQEGRVAEAKDAARKALEKGASNPDAAKKILAR